MEESVRTTARVPIPRPVATRRTNYQPDDVDERPVNFEAPHPILRVPGMGQPEWDRRLGRWVIYRRTR